MKSLLFLMIAFMTFSSFGSDSESDPFDALGGNRSLLKRVQALNPEISGEVVQNRFVKRERRFEIAPEWSLALGGDTYVRTQSLGLNGYYHVTPQFSVSLKYQHAFNRLTPEGHAMVQSAYAEYQQNPAAPEGLMPEVNPTLSHQLLAFQWYPVYGKVSWLGKSVTQFDVYLNAGFGSVELLKGRSVSQQLGGGIGLWLSPRMSLRGELFWQGYEAQYMTGLRDMNLTQLSLQMGWLL